MDSYICVRYVFVSVSYDLEFLYEIAHVGYVECFIDYEFLLMIVKGY